MWVTFFQSSHTGKNFRLTISYGKKETAIVCLSVCAKAGLLDLAEVLVGRTFRLVGEEVLPESVGGKLQGWNWGAHTLCTLHLALNEPPRYLSSSFDPDIDRTYDVHFGAESGEEITENFNEVHRG